MKNRRGSASKKEPLKVVSAKPAPAQILYKQQTNKGEKFTIYVPLRISSGFFIFLGKLFKFFTLLVVLGCFSLASLWVFAPPLWRSQISSHLQKFSSNTQKNALIQGLSHPDKKVREASLQQLGELGPLAKEAVPKIEICLQDEEESVRNAAAQALGKIDPEANSLIPQSHSSPSPQNTSSSENTSSSTQSNSSPKPEAPTPIEPRSDPVSNPPKTDSDSEKTSQNSNKSSGTEPIEPQDETKTLVVNGFLEKKQTPLPEKKNENIPRLLENLKDTDEKVRANARFLLSQQGALSIPALDHALQTEEYELRREVGLVLGKMGALAVPTLINALKNENWSHRYIAADALCDIGPEAILALPHLIQTAQDPNKNVQESSIKALGELGPNATTATPVLLDLLDDTTTHFRILAAEALFKIGAPSEKAIRTLKEIQKEHDNEGLRKLANEILQKFSNTNSDLNESIK